MPIYPLICEWCKIAVLGTVKLPEGAELPSSSGSICEECRPAWQAQQREQRKAEEAKEVSDLKKRLGIDRQMEEHGLLLHGRHIEEDLAQLLEQASPNSPVSVAFIDMNNLKGINDQYGHDAGDDAIVEYLAAVKLEFSRNATAYRCKDGGDEVVVIMPETSTVDALDRVRQLLRRLSNATISSRSERISLAASCGLATAQANESPSNVVKRADAAMYCAKNASKAAGSRCALAADGSSPELI